LGHLAPVHALSGDAGQACAAVGQCAEIARRPGSLRPAGMLSQIRAGLVTRWPHDPRVAELTGILH
jgi:hypothetical protein